MDAPSAKTGEDDEPMSTSSRSKHAINLWRRLSLNDCSRLSFSEGSPPWCGDDDRECSGDDEEDPARLCCWRVTAGRLTRRSGSARPVSQGACSRSQRGGGRRCAPFAISAASLRTHAASGRTLGITGMSTNSASRSSNIISCSPSRSGPTSCGSLLSSIATPPSSSPLCTIVHPFLVVVGGTIVSPWDGYDEPGLGTLTWVYEKARVELELFCDVRGTGFGADVAPPDGRVGVG
jgi:hypothetical protein